MDELEISGKRYISTRLAAKEHKYHADYIGQLIRGKKILGQKVGRSWYVEEKSLAAYFGGEAPVHLEEPAVVAKAPRVEVVEEAEQEVEEVQVTEARVSAQKSAASNAAVTAEIIAAAAQILEAAKAAASVAKVSGVAVVEEAPILEEEKIPVHMEAAAIPEEASQEQEVEPAVEIEPAVRDSIHIPIRVTRPSFVALKNKAGLRYIDDDAPALPEVIKKNRSPRARVESTSVTNVDNEEVFITQYAATEGSSGILVPAFSIAVLGLVAFAVVAVSSVIVDSNLMIDAGKTASAWYSLH